jgi:[ribosomal protein S18]-alanine N-acetyltransferase
VKIRKATVDDIPLMIELDRTSATSAHWTEPQYRGLLSPARLVLVASNDEAPHAPVIKENLLGFIVALHIAPDWELENIVVLLGARRMGIGKRLLDALLAAVRKTNSEAVFLEVRESNEAARLFYEKSGFIQSGRRKSYYSNPLEDAVLYRLALTKPFS